MINYETSDSPHFIHHAEVVQKLEADLKMLNCELNGYCNSFGYKVSGAFGFEKYHVNVMAEKYQTPQNGVIIPVDANEHTYTKVRISGLPTHIKGSSGKSGIKRLFSPGKFKSLAPAPIYVFGNLNTKFLENMDKKDSFNLNVNHGIVEFTRYSLIVDLKGCVQALCTLGDA